MITLIVLSRKPKRPVTFPSASRFNVDTLTLYNWRLSSRLPVSPIRTQPLTISQLVLHVDGNSKFDDLEELDGHPWEAPYDIPSVKIILGWSKFPARNKTITAKTARAAVISGLDCIKEALPDLCTKQITISPHVEGGNHVYCFPQSLPDIELSERFPAIAFRTDCTCGHGDTTGCESPLHVVPVILSSTHTRSGSNLNSVAGNQAQDSEMAKNLDRS
jgi:hypothetical protein